jgi:hypothetical protein
MEFFFKRLEKYVQFRPSAAMMDIIMKVMVEVISILGIVTKEIGQGRTSMPLSIIYLHMLMFTQRSMLRNCLGGMRSRTRFDG